MNQTPQPYESRFGSEWGEEERIQLALQIFRQRQRTQGTQYSASQVLFEHLSGFQPDWEDLPLPLGRTVAQGKIVYSSYSRSGPSTARSSGPSPGSYAFPNTGGATGTVPSRKRSAPSDSTLTPTTGRPLMPKQPSTFPSEPGGRSITGHQPISPLVEPPPTLGEPRKKRGRPTKQEAEERRRQMEERNQARLAAQAAGTYGSPYAPHQLQQSYQPSVPPPSVPPSVPPPVPRGETPGTSVPPSAPTAVMQTPQAQNPSAETEQNSSGSSGKRRKTRPPKLSVSEPEPPSQPSLGIATAYGSPPHSGSNRGRRASVSARLSGPPLGPPPQQDQEGTPRFNAPEDNRPQNPRSRAWEDTVMGRSGP